MRRRSWRRAEASARIPPRRGCRNHEFVGERGASAQSASPYVQGVSARRSCVVVLVVWAGAAGLGESRPQARDAPLRTTKAVDDAVTVEQGLAIVRLDPKPGAPPNECDAVGPSDLSVLVGGFHAPVVAVEPIPRPERHWLVVDISESAEGRRLEAKRSALQYVREVMTPGVDSATLVTVDEDAIVVLGPTTDT